MRPICVQFEHAPVPTAHGTPATPHRGSFWIAVLQWAAPASLVLLGTLAISSLVSREVSERSAASGGQVQPATRQ